MDRNGNKTYKVRAVLRGELREYQLESFLAYVLLVLTFRICCILPKPLRALAEAFLGAAELAFYITASARTFLTVWRGAKRTNLRKSDVFGGPHLPDSFVTRQHILAGPFPEGTGTAKPKRSWLLDGEQVNETGASPPASFPTNKNSPKNLLREKVKATDDAGATGVFTPELTPLCSPQLLPLNSPCAWEQDSGEMARKMTRSPTALGGF